MALGTLSLRILVADDNEDHLLAFVPLLQDDGHEVVSVREAEQVVGIAERFRPQVCLLDIGMPRLNGYDLAQRLRARWGTAVKLIAVTAYATLADQARAESAGFDVHVPKPLNPVALLSDLQKIARALA